MTHIWLQAWKRRAMTCMVFLFAAIAIGLMSDISTAQTPFGGPRPSGAEPHAGNIFGWIIAKQSEFYRQISAAIRAAKADGSAIWTLLGISFAYGVFHAAGPGHGKAVISSYLVANEETARRGIVLSFASALLQSLVAILLVGIGAWLLNVTAGAMCSAERVIEIASYALIALVGARLVWSKGRGLLRTLQAARVETPPQLAMAGAHGLRIHSDMHHEHAHPVREHPHHDHAHETYAHASHAHSHEHAQDHVHDEHCGHTHGPDPLELAGAGGWQRGLSAIVATGLRPCSGAILVLVFALAQGLFLAGVAATLAMGIGTALTVSAIAIMAVSAKGLAKRIAAGRDGNGAIILRGLEFAAAALVLLFGAGLLLGYVVAERVTCF